jgi:transposase
VIDASAAASVAALQGDAADDETNVFALLDERRANLAAHRVRSVNQLHALMRDLVAGGPRTALTAKVAAAPLRSVRPATPTEHARKAMAWDLVRNIRSLDNQLVKVAEQMAAALDDYGSSLLDIDGIGPVLAVRIRADRSVDR